GRIVWSVNAITQTAAASTQGDRAGTVSLQDKAHAVCGSRRSVVETEAEINVESSDRPAILSKEGAGLAQAGRQRGSRPDQARIPVGLNVVVFAEATHVIGVIRNERFADVARAGSVGLGGIIGTGVKRVHHIRVDPTRVVRDRVEKGRLRGGK